MPKEISNPPRSVSKIDAASIKVPPVSTSLEEQQRLPINQSPNDKDRGRSNPLIKQLRVAVIAGDIKVPITAHSLPKWMAAFDIRKGDGTKYKNFNAGSFLANSYIRKRNKTNRNTIWLDRKKMKSGIYGYWFYAE